jgi:hypothetical protein
VYRLSMRRVCTPRRRDVKRKPTMIRQKETKSLGGRWMSVFRTPRVHARWPRESIAPRLQLKRPRLRSLCRKNGVSRRGRRALSAMGPQPVVRLVSFRRGHSRDTLSAATQAHPRHLGDARWLPTGERLGGRSPADQVGRWGRPGSRRWVQLTASTVRPASAAVSVSFTTPAGCETIARCPEGTSAVVAPMRLANMR